MDVHFCGWDADIWAYWLRGWLIKRGACQERRRQELSASVLADPLSHGGSPAALKKFRLPPF